MITINGTAKYEEEIKKSRFIAVAKRIDNPASQKKYLLKELCDPKANHNCWAYKKGNEFRFSDDGEPGGTAGQPILAAIQGTKFDNVILVVQRFFGGIKLGTGGLVRAYSGTASKCLNSAVSFEILNYCKFKVKIPFELTGSVYKLIDKLKVQKEGEEFSDSGITLKLKIRENNMEIFRNAFFDATSGKAIFFSRN